MKAKQYSEVEVLLKPFITASIQTSNDALKARFILATAYDAMGQYQNAFDTLTLLLNNLGTLPSAVSKNDAAKLQEQIKREIAHEQELVATSAAEKEPAHKFAAQGDLEAYRHHSDKAFVFYTQAYQALENNINVTPLDRLEIEKKYGTALLEQPAKSRARPLRMLALSLLTDYSASTESLRYGLKLAETLLNQKLEQPERGVGAYAQSVAKMITGPSDPWVAKVQGAHILSMVLDRQGRLWVGTEDEGVWCDDTVSGTGWTQYTIKDGLGDNAAYALSCDVAGRIWVGHLKHGVSVYDGKTWRNYGLVDGPGGSRVFALATNPRDGDVWIATEAGLGRYSTRQDRWLHYTQAQGLPANQLSALDFDHEGRLFVGTASEGIAIAGQQDNYNTWQRIAGPNQIPNTPEGLGLPSSLINNIFVTRDDTVWIGTTCGLAHSTDHGQHWQYIRGVDWFDKAKALYKNIKQTPLVGKGQLLLEDYVTCLTQDDVGNLFIGYRQKGFEIIEPATTRRIYPLKYTTPPVFYMSCMMPIQKGYVLLGRYGEGIDKELPFLASSSAAAQPQIASEKTPIAAGGVKLPTSAIAPTTADLKELCTIVQAIPPAKESAAVVILNDDWCTEGDWLGRYGRYSACLNALCSPHDYSWGAGWEAVHYKAQMGPHHKKNDSLRYWVHWLYTKNPRSLELPPTYLDSRVKRKSTTWDVNRRQSEQDDHGEAYAYTYDGPHIYYTITVPKGLFYLSLYDFNKDGHTGNNRYRDYLVSVRAHPANLPLSNIDNFDQQPELARVRLNDFWGGVYKRFLVQGPAQYTIKVGRNNSFNTILAAVMLDLVDETPAPYFMSMADWKQREVEKNEERQKLLARWSSMSGKTIKADISDSEADRLFTLLEQKRLVNPMWWSQEGPRFYAPLLRAYREALPKNKSDTIQKHLLARLGSCYYYVGQFTEWEDCQRRLGMTPARDIEHALRWDGISDAGQGYSVVTSYLAAHPEINKNSNFILSHEAKK